MSYEDALMERINSLNKDILKKIINYRANIERKEFGLAQIKASEILELKSLLRSNQDIAFYMFNMEPEQGYFTN